MSTKKKNIPTIAELTAEYHYITAKDRGGLLKHHAGSLIPLEYYYAKSTEFVDLYMTECSLHFARLEYGGRLIRLKGKYYQEAKLVWLYNTGTYPLTAIMHKDGDRMNTLYSNLVLTSVSSVTQSKSGVAGIYQLTTGYNAHMWVAYYIRNEYQELPIDENGKPLPQREFRTKGWHNRRTKVFNKRIQKLIGYYMTKERAIQAQKRYVNETLHPICRYRVDMKLKRLCATLMGMYPDSPSSATWHYLQLLYNRGVIDEAEALDYAEMLGHGSKVLPAKNSA